MVVYLELPKVNGLEEEKAKHEPNIGHTPMDILLVDDNPGDVRMVVEALKEALPAARLSVAIDGTEAMRFLRRNQYVLCFLGMLVFSCVMVLRQFPSRSRNGFCLPWNG